MNNNESIKNISATSSLSLLLIIAFMLYASHVVQCQSMDSMPGMDMGAQQADTAKAAKSGPAAMAMDTGTMDVAHPFYTHMGMPDAVGSYALRLSGVATRNGGSTKGDFGFHLETGLSKTLGFHIRNDRVRDNPHTEITFQFAAISSRDGMSGFSPFMEFEVPTHHGEKTIYTLVGFSTAWATGNFALNQSLEYSPKEDVVEGSASAVVKVFDRFFPVAELIGGAARGAAPVGSALAGLKYRINGHLTAGLAYKLPLSTVKEFDSQVQVQTDIEW
jgi:hypothetical protein